MDDNVIRAGWKVGALCQIYWSSRTRWCEGEIVDIFTDEEGEWLQVQYGKLMSKQIQRYSSSIRPYPDDSKNNGAGSKVVTSNNDGIILTMSQLSIELGKLFKVGKIQDLTTRLQQQLNNKIEQNNNHLTMDTNMNTDYHHNDNYKYYDSIPKSLPYIDCNQLYQDVVGKCKNCQIELCVSHQCSDKCLIATYRSNKLEYQCRKCLSISRYKHLFSLTKLVYDSLFRENVYEINIIKVITNYLYHNVIKCENNMRFWNCSDTILIEKNIENQITDFNENYVNLKSCIIQNKPNIICIHCHHDKEGIDCSDCDDISDIE